MLWPWWKRHASWRKEVASIAKFYKEVLGAAVSEDDGSCKVYFSPGETLTQTLHFQEDEELASDQDDSHVHQEEAMPQICIYMPSEAKFQSAASTGISENALKDSSSPNKVTNEFHLSGCIPEKDAGNASTHPVIAMRHIVRSPSHPQCPIEEQAADGQNTSGSLDIVISQQELSKHKQKTDCWVAVNGRVYDVTKWLKVHPGGQPILLSKAGTEVTDEWNMIHKPGTIERYIEKPFGPKLMGTIRG